MDPLQKENYQPFPNRPEKNKEEKTKIPKFTPPNRPPPLPPTQRKAKEPVYRKLENSPIPLPETAPLAKKAPKPKNVSFEQMVKHRLHRGKATDAGYIREVSDRADLPLVDESSGTDAKSLTKSEANKKIALWAKEIRAWKAKPKEERPTGHSMTKDWRRQNPSLSTKALTGREESKIRKSNFSPSWIANRAPLDRMARQAALEMGLEELKLTPENLVKFMLPINEMGRDVVTIEELEDLFYILYPNEKRMEPEKPEKTLTPREKWLIENIMYAELPGVDSIQKRVDGKFVIKYQKYTHEEIVKYVIDLFYKEKA